MKHRALFLDRDGVLVRAVARDDYANGPLSLEEFAILPGVAEPVRRIRDAGFLAVLATNQPGVARGHIRMETLDEMHRLLRAAVPLDHIEVCPHTDADGCPCRKPKPGMLLAAAEKLAIDLGASYFVGDTRRDHQAALAAGVTPVLIDYPYNRTVDAPHRVRDLGEAAQLVLNGIRERTP
jgi:D-glycero-D-manno-heptose 1,7-bisphosphate phosphatase